LAERVRKSVTVALAVLPPIVLLTMNSLAWGSDLEAIALAIRQLRRGGSHAVFGISLLIALGFIVWVGPDAYLDIAAAVSGP